MLDRIRTLLTARQLSPTQFADTIGVSRPIVSHILSGRNKPSLEVVQKIVGAFPDLSLRWLLNGEGTMLAVVSPPEPITASSRARTTPVAATAPVLVPIEAATAPEVQPIEPTAPPVAAVAALSYPEPAVQAAAAATPAPAQPAPATPTFAVDPAPEATHQVVSASGGSSMAAGLPVGAELARGLATPGKGIRRIVIFYQDGTFADYQPEAAS